MKTATTRQTTNLLKKHLKETFGITCSVKSEKYSGGSSLTIWYDLGPDKSVIQAIINNLQYGRFDAMTDMYEHVENIGMVIDGYQLEEFRHVFVKQQIPEDFSYKLAKFFSDNRKYQNVPPLESKDQMNSNFSEIFGGAWTWGQMLYQEFKTRNFATQDPEKINLISVVDVEAGCSGDIAFVYEVDGVEYRTDKLPELKAKKPTSTPEFEKVEVAPGEVQILEYSERSIAVAVIPNLSKIYLNHWVVNSISAYPVDQVGYSLRQSLRTFKRLYQVRRLQTKDVLLVVGGASLRRSLLFLTIKNLTISKCLILTFSLHLMK